MTRGRREKPGKLRALEVRLVREVQVLNLKPFLMERLHETVRRTAFATRA